MTVRRTITLLMILLSLPVLLLAQSDNIAVVIKTRGDVYVTPEGSARSERAKKGQVLKSGSKIETAAEAFCAIKFLDDKSLLRIQEKSTCLVEGKRKDDTIDKNIFAEIGNFFASLFEPKGRFEIRTPTSVASVKGTQFWVQQLGASGGTRYMTLEGVVEVSNSAGKVLVREGQTAEVESLTRQPIVRLTREGELPGEEETGGSFRSVDVEFQNSNGDKKILRIQVQE